MATDRDPAAFMRRQSKPFGDRFRFYAMHWRSCGLGRRGFDGILFDFALAFQLDTAERGSFREDAPADMRMNPDAGISAAEFLETADESALVRAVRNYGEEKRWRRVVQAISTRGYGLFATYAILADLCSCGRADATRAQAVHPATEPSRDTR